MGKWREGQFTVESVTGKGPVDPLVMPEGLHITVHCPVCHTRMIDPHEAPQCHIVAGGRLWLECTKCPRQIEIEIKFITRWVGEQQQ